MSFPPDLHVAPMPWLSAKRIQAVRFLEIHATRGTGTQESQFMATVHWMESQNNRAVVNGVPQNWGAACSYIIGHDGRLGVVLPDSRFPTYNAGYGASISNGWSIDEYGIGYEWCQSAAQEEYTTAQYERGAIEYAAKCRQYGIAVAMLNIPSQTGPVPSGFVRHDRCENGAKLGKSDPGPKFRDADFIALVREKMETEDDMALTEDQNNKLNSIWQKVEELWAGKPGTPLADQIDEIQKRLTELETANTTHVVTVKHE